MVKLEVTILGKKFKIFHVDICVPLSLDCLKEWGRKMFEKVKDLFNPWSAVKKLLDFFRRRRNLEEINYPTYIPDEYKHAYVTKPQFFILV